MLVTKWERIFALQIDGVIKGNRLTAEQCKRAYDYFIMKGCNVNIIVNK